MKTKHDFIVDYLFEENGHFSQHEYDLINTGFEFATRWYTFDEEIPVHNVRIETKDIHGDVITFKFTGSSNIKDSAKAMSFTHWRPIYK